MQKLHLKPHELLKEVSPGQIGLQYGSVQRIEMSADENRSFSSNNREFCIFILKGNLQCKSGRTSAETGMKDAIYLPRNERIDLHSITDSVFMLYAAPSDRDAELTFFRYREILKNPDKCHVYGSKENNSERTVLNYLDDSFNASRLMAGICEGSTGGWTAWPPHEHAAEREEIYIYFNLRGGFAIQCVYEDMQHPLCVAMVTEGDLVSIPSGYHPNVASPHGPISYIYVMIAKEAGNRQFMDLRVQPEYGDKFK